MFLYHIARFIDDEGCGDCCNPAKVLHYFLITHNDRIIHTKLLHKRLHYGWALLVERDSDDHESFVLILFLQFDKAGNLSLAWRTPSCPKIQNNDFAREI